MNVRQTRKALTSLGDHSKPLLFLLRSAEGNEGKGGQQAAGFGELSTGVRRNEALALAYLGDIEMKRKDPDKALPLQKKAVQLKHDIGIAYSDLGTIFLERKQYQYAMTVLQRAVELDPAQPDAHFRLGRLYQTMGNTLAAQKEFAGVRELHEKEDEAVAAKTSAAPPPLPQ